MLTINSSTISVDSANALVSDWTSAYLDQAAEWGQQAGEAIVREEEQRALIEEVENGLAIQTITTGSSNTGLPNASQFRWYRLNDIVPERTSEEPPPGWMSVGWPYRTPTEEEARQAREREFAQDRAAWRARELLLRNLSPRQREEFETLHRFTVVTRRKHRYVIGNCRNQNVVRVNRRGKPMRVYCLSVLGGVPTEDALLGQKLMLEHDEPHFLKVARQWPLRFALGVGDLVKAKKSKVRFVDLDSPTAWEVVQDLTNIPVLTINGRPVAA